MGSGETAPTMVKVHRSIAERVLASGTEPDTEPDTEAAGARTTVTGPSLMSVRGILLDTPFGFQTNASEIAARAASYFAESVGATLEVAGMRSSADLTGERGHEIVARIAALPLVFSGPGSPSYALRQWKGTLVPSLLAEKLELGGAVTFASAAALTLGSATVPVYEVYKVGEDPHWLEGLDLLEPLGLPVALIPHYDNAEGQTHDTRYCYLGEERLSLMEAELDEETFVLGVDEHTALCVDLDAASAAVVGRGAVTVRVHGRSTRIEADSTVSLARIREVASELASVGSRRSPTASRGGDSAGGEWPPIGDEGTGESDTDGQRGETSFAEATADESSSPAGSGGSPLLLAIRTHESAFRFARERSDAHAMAAAALALEQEMWAWRADTLQSDEMDRGRASLRAMIADLGQLAEFGTRDPAEVIGPYIEVLVDLRDRARRDRRFAEADSVRDRLTALGVALHDTSEGSTWELADTDGGTVDIARDRAP
jgi:hypothetical protein